MNFDDEFKKLTGFAPMRWQRRLYDDYSAKGHIPASLDIPTGLGKTSVMALWYLARKAGAVLPRRLVYVVDRRAVVDQATTVADQIKERSGDTDLRISTLRGQYVDNREWLEDPSKTAIIVGTVDMVGSRLLFSGYGVSRKTRSYHAGLLGADTMVVLDESHLVPSFERLLEAIEGDTEMLGARSKDDRAIVPPFRLLSLSATGHERKGKPFHLDESKGDLDDDEAPKRLNARKHLSIEPCNSRKLDEALAESAWQLSSDGKQTLRILVYCNSREIAEKTKQALEATAKKAKTAIETELFVGARRVRERVNAADKLTTLGFLANSDVRLEKPAFLFATSAGEVGVDMDADHMVCDLVEWERMVQRFGRVNRKGDGDARVVLVIDPPIPTKKEAEAQEKKDRGEKLNEKEQKTLDQHESKCRALRERKAPLSYLPKEEDRIVISPGALMDIKSRAGSDSKLQQVIDTASTPPPLYPALTRALVDAWSMTSLDMHTGRPEIAPWLRGWVDNDAPQTTVVWRKYLPVRVQGKEATKKDIEEFFDAAPSHLSEKLETETWRVFDWLGKRAAAAVKRDKEWADSVVAFALDTDGGLRKSLRATELVPDGNKEREKKRKEVLDQALAGATLIVDSRLGGLSDDGLLNTGADSDGLRTADDGEDWPADVGFRIFAAAGDHALDKSTRVTFSFAIRQSSEGEDIERLLIETTKTENSRAASSHPQVLEEHQSWAEDRGRKIATALGLTGNHVEVVAIAARLHDEGKRAMRWQRAFNAKGDGIYAKTKGPLILARLGGYRHEFGSLPYAEKDAQLQKLPAELQDLVLHLIAAHHGRARPVIGTDGCEDAPPSVLETRARDVALRFARLQKQWGPWGLAWWEALLRAADQQASRDNDKRGNGHG